MAKITVETKKKIFFILEKIRKEPIEKVLKELIKNQEKNSDFLDNLQERKLSRLIKHSYLYSPFYRKLFTENKISPEKIKSINDLKKIPLLNKTDVRENTKKIASTIGPKVYPVKTSGSTGAPLFFYKDRISSAYGYAAMFRGHKWHGLDICAKEAYLWGIPLKKTERMQAKLRDFFLNRFREKEFNLSSKMSQDFYRMMLKKKPEILSGYSSLLYEFAMFIQEKEMPVDPIKPKVIKYTAEMMHEYEKELIEKVFDCPVIGEYGSAEMGVIAFQCPCQKYHIMSECCIIEFEKIEDCNYYEIIATNLNSMGFPLIRYRTGDLTDKPYFSKCQCGLPFPVLENILGRCNEIVITPEGKRIHSNIFSYIIKYLLKKGYPIRKINFIQEKKSEIKVLLNKAILNNSQIKNDISDLIYQRVSPNINVFYGAFDDENKSRSGKLRYFISKIEKTKNLYSQ